MITITLTAKALSTIRFSLHPLFEAVESLRVLDKPTHPPFAMPWIRRARDRLAGGVPLLRALVRADAGYLPDFLTPWPEHSGSWQTNGVGIDKALAQVADTPGEQISRELALVYRELPMPTSWPGHAPTELERMKSLRRPMPAEVADALRGGESGFARQVSDALATYWDRALAPDWPAIEDVLNADVRHRAGRLATTGFAGLFADLHNDLGWDGRAIIIDRPSESTMSPDTVLLTPSLFCWPRLRYSIESHRVSLSYPARGLAERWQPTSNEVSKATADLIGATRAGLLADLDEARTTTELAARHNLTPSTASHHLRALHQSGLLERTRYGREVLYQINDAGRQLRDRTHRGASPDR
jgi:DNA-binding transcriptional ArsR family regulator